MNSVKIIAGTMPWDQELIDNGVDTPDKFIAYCARVSNPSNQFNTMTAPKLIQYCAENKHWSIFEQVSVNAEVETTRDIARQILRHRSFSFQEFSQRYADPTKTLGFVTREARLQDKKNRQNSIEIDDGDLKLEWEEIQNKVIDLVQRSYAWAIHNGIAKEQARAVLPEGLTSSRMFMNGTLRSYIHWVAVRANMDTQKEHRIIARNCWDQLKCRFPSLTDDLIEIKWEQIKETIEK